MGKHSKTQRRNMRRRARRHEKAAEDGEDDDDQSLIGMMCTTKEGRHGKIIVFDPNDKLLELKIEFTDGLHPMSDWVSGDDVVPYNPDGQSASGDESEFDGDLNDFPEEEGIGHAHGLEEVPGGIAVDSGAADNVMSKRHLKGYTIGPSPGSKAGRRWGSASGHAIPNEGEVVYNFMVESGDIKKGKTQVGEVRRPLAAVSQLTKDKRNIVFFCEDEDWIIPRSDPITQEIIKLVKKAKDKTKMHSHKGTYRMRAWLVPEQQPAKGPRPFGRPGM